MHAGLAVGLRGRGGWVCREMKPQNAGGELGAPDRMKAIAMQIPRPQRGQQTACSGASAPE